MSRKQYSIIRQQDGSDAANSHLFHATNRSQNLHTVFSNEGIQIQSKNTKPSAWRTGLVLEKMGKRGTIHALSEPMAAHAEGNRIEFDRGTVATLTLTDGGDGDTDFTKNGIILDPSGLVRVAVVQPPVQGGTTPTEGSSGSGGRDRCFISTLKTK